MNETQEVKRTECGWAGHFIMADKCNFRRNTHLSYCDTNIVVSTVGDMRNVNGIIQTVGYKRFYETMVFFGDDTKYHDADVLRGEIETDEYNIVSEEDYEKTETPDLLANEIHEKIVDEMTEKLLKGEIK